jgi:hypothetical protein
MVYEHDSNSPCYNKPHCHLKGNTVARNALLIKKCSIFWRNLDDVHTNLKIAKFTEFGNEFLGS